MAFDISFLIVGYDSWAKRLLFVSFLDHSTTVLIRTLPTHIKIRSLFRCSLKYQFSELWLFNTIHIHWFLNGWIEYWVIVIYLYEWKKEIILSAYKCKYMKCYCHSNYFLNKILVHLMQSCGIMNFIIIIILNDVGASRMIKMAHCCRSLQAVLCAYNEATWPENREKKI